MNNSISFADDSFAKGSYETAYEMYNQALKNGNCDGKGLIRRALSKIALFNSDSDINVLSADLSVAYEQLVKFDYQFDDLFHILDDCLLNSISIKNKLESELKIKDKKLSSQYKTITGARIISDDAELEYKIASEERQRMDYNNSINYERQILNETYKQIIDKMFSHMLNCLFSSEIIKTNMYAISLSFVDKLESIKESVSLEEAKKIIEFKNNVKKLRNEHYWNQHSDLYTSLCNDLDSCKKQISKISKQQIEDTTKKIDDLNQEIKDAKKERRRFSIFNITDRKPLNNIISENSHTVKSLEKKLKSLKQGKCEECKTYEDQVKKIEMELSIQR